MAFAPQSSISSVKPACPWGQIVVLMLLYSVTSNYLQNAPSKWESICPNDHPKKHLVLLRPFAPKTPNASSNLAALHNPASTWDKSAVTEQNQNTESSFRAEGFWFSGILLAPEVWNNGQRVPVFPRSHGNLFLAQIKRRDIKCPWIIV